MQFKPLGVMNITPNSFSDPGLNLTDDVFYKNLNIFLTCNFSSLDFGAESTASKNSGLVNSDLEWHRIEKYLIPKLLNNPQAFEKLEYLSLDTYRLDTLLKFHKVFRSHFPTMKLIWNDVSGVKDHEIEDFFKLFSEELKNGLIKYVANFTFVSERSRASFHMDFSQHDKDIIHHFLSFESSWINLFSKHQAQDALVIDPGFGFSKSYLQNIELLNYLIKDYQPKNQAYLIGLSKKSFLREKFKELHPEALGLEASLLMEKTEGLHRHYLDQLQEHFASFTNVKTIWLRVHNPHIFS